MPDLLLRRLCRNSFFDVFFPVSVETSQKLALVPDLSTSKEAFGTYRTAARSRTSQPVDGLFSTVSLSQILFSSVCTLTDTSALLPSTQLFLAGRVSGHSAILFPLLAQTLTCSLVSPDNATIGSILSYVFYWIVAIVALAYMKWSEGRTTIFGYKSAAGHRREARRQQQLEKVDSYEKSDKAETPLDEDRQFASHV